MRKIEKQEEQEEQEEKKLEKQTTGQVGVEAAILEQKNVLKWRRPCKSTSQ
jgi:hypothetical protein